MHTRRETCIHIYIYNNADTGIENELSVLLSHLYLNFKTDFSLNIEFALTETANLLAIKKSQIRQLEGG